MAIKTKKISDLSEITSLDEHCYFVGHKNDETSKISFVTISTEVEEIVKSKVEEIIKTEVEEIVKEQLAESVAPAAELEENEVSVDVEKLHNSVNELTAYMNDIAEQYKVLNRNYTNFALASSEKISKLQEDNAKLVQFIKSLQKDDYLTLAEIKKAASEAFPIDETTSETETTGEE